MQRTVGYARVSVIVDDSTSIARQERDVRALAEREGLDLVDILVDEGISGRKARAKADEAVRMLAAGEVDVLIAWRLDRLTRGGMAALVPLLEALERPGAAFWTCDGHRSDSTAFRLTLAVLSEIARAEVEATAARARSAVAYRRTVSHKYAGGASVPYGYRSVPADDGVGRVLTIEPVECQLIQEVANLLLDGWSPRRVAEELNRRQVPTSKSAARRAARTGADTVGLDVGAWTVATVRALWSAPTILGRQTHRGDLVRGPDGLPAALWPPLVTLDTAERLRRVLEAPGASPKKGRAARLLSGVAYCGVCDARMYVTTSGGKPIYSCPTRWGTAVAGACVSPKIDAIRIEEYVTDTFLRVAGAWPEYRDETVAANPDAAASLADVEQALAEATQALMADGADDAAIFARMQELKGRRVALRDAAGDVTRALVATGRTLGEAWAAETDTEARRGVLLYGLDHVTVAPAKYPLEPVEARVRVVWGS